MVKRNNLYLAALAELLCVFFLADFRSKVPTQIIPEVSNSSISVIISSKLKC